MNEVCNSNSKGNALSPQLRYRIRNLTSPNEDKFLPYQYRLPRSSTRQFPRKNKYRFQHEMARPWVFDAIDTSVWLHSPNAISDHNSCCVYGSIYSVPSRSAKIMRALSSADGFLRQETRGIRKSLNFDSTPSSRESSTCDESSTSSFSTDTPSSVFNSSTTDSTNSNVPVTSAESIDENQNQTPQQNRKSSNRTDIKEIVRSRTCYLMSLLKEKEKERTDKNANHRSSHPFCSFNPFIGSKGPSRSLNASVPRNLSEEFNKELDDRPHTPENVISIIPESISAIKKSHKKEKCSHEEQSFTQRMDVSVKNDNLHSRITTESSETDMIAESNYNDTSENESQKKNRNIKRTLIYNDENRDTRSDSDCSILQITTSTENDLLENELDQIESAKIQYTDSNDDSREENMHISLCLTDHNDEEKDRSNVCNEEVSQVLLQKELSGTCNANVMSENRMTSPESNSNTSQDANKVVTPENNINMLKHVLAKSIKKSHKKMKHGNKKTLFKTKDLSHKKVELARSEISIEGVCNIDQDIESQIDTTRDSSPQNRPSTPENVNSSRLLLLDFNSIKKSHKKDKRKNFVECFDYERRKRSHNSLRGSKYEEEIRRISRRNKSLRSTESPNGMSPKKKKPVSILQSSTPKFSNAFASLGCRDINDEFKIFTPIKKLPILAVTNYISSAETSQEEDRSAQAISKEIDCFRCVTPIARDFDKLRKNEALTSGHDNTESFETDVGVLKVTDTNMRDENGRSTPINMSTSELLCSIDSIKKSHKKNKHNRSKRPLLKKKRSHRDRNEESGHVNFASNEKMLAEAATLSLKQHSDKHCAEKMCSTREKKKSKRYKEIAYDDPQPSTSRGGDNMESARNTTKSKFLDTTPPNSLCAMNLMKLVHTTSIKKSHKRERDINAQAKYILMTQELELSDDGSIFDEQDRLNFIENNSVVRDNNSIIE